MTVLLTAEEQRANRDRRAQVLRATMAENPEQDHRGAKVRVKNPSLPSEEANQIVGSASEMNVPVTRNAISVEEEDAARVVLQKMKDRAPSVIPGQRDVQV